MLDPPSWLTYNPGVTNTLGGRMRRVVESIFLTMVVATFAPSLLPAQEAPPAPDLTEQVRRLEARLRQVEEELAASDRKSTRLNSSHRSLSYVPLFLVKN